MNISGNVVFNPDSHMDQSAISQPIANIPVALQLQGSTSEIGAMTAEGLVVQTNANGEFQFTDVPEAGTYRVIEASGYTGAISTTGSWKNRDTITVQPKDPKVSQIANPPEGTTHIQSLSPNTQYVTGQNGDITNLRFIDSPVRIIMETSNRYHRIGANLIGQPNNGSLRTLANGMPIQISNEMGNPTYTTLVTDCNSAEGTGRMIIAKGGTSKKRILSTTVRVDSNQDYEFSSLVMNLDSTGTTVAPTFRLKVTGKGDGTGGESELLYNRLVPVKVSPTSIPTWREVADVFNSGNHTVLSVEYVSEGGAETSPYAIDNIVLAAVGNGPISNLQKQVSTTIAEPGDRLVYTLTYSNTGSDTETAQNVVFRDVVPNGSVYVPDTLIINDVQQQGTVNLSSGVSIGSVAPGASGSISFSVAVNQGLETGTILNNTGELLYSYTAT